MSWISIRNTRVVYTPIVSFQKELGQMNFPNNKVTLLFILFTSIISFQKELGQNNIPNNKVEIPVDQLLGQILATCNHQLW